MQQIGPYRVLNEVARGGMGVVFRAQAPDGRLVAVKLLLTADPSPAQRQRFQTELETLRRLEHPHVVSVLGAGEHQGHPYLVLEFVEGETLQRRLDRGVALRPEAAAELTLKLARAVGAAHEVAILHRDLKPANVLIDAQGQPRLTDFGLAKDLSSDSKLSRTGTFLGSPGYWPPEQAVGELRGIGPHSDVYGLGATLYALLTRRPPLVAESLPETIALTEHVRPHPPSAENPAVNDALDAICLKCLEKQPGDRYLSVQALARDLERYLAGLPPLALEQQGAARAPLWIAAGVVAAGLGFALWLVATGDAPTTLAASPSAPAESPSSSPAALPTAPEVTPAALDPAPTEPPSELALREAELTRQPDLGGWVGLCEQALEAEEDALAYRAAARAAELAPDDFEVAHRLASALLRAGKPLAATPYVERAHTLRPEHLDARVHQVQLVRLSEDYVEATRQLVEGMQIDPKHGGIEIERAWLVLERRRLDKAESMFTSLLEQHPDDPYVLAGAGRLRLYQERWAEAEALLERSLAGQERSYQTWWALGVARARQDRPEQALACYDRAASLPPGPFALPGEAPPPAEDHHRGPWLQLHLERALLLERLGQLERARADVRAILELDAHRPAPEAFAWVAEQARELDRRLSAPR